MIFESYFVFCRDIYVAPMSMESTGRQVGNLESYISDIYIYILVFPNQLQLPATFKLLVSLGSSSVDLISLYKPFVLNLCMDDSKLMYNV